MLCKAKHLILFTVLRVQLFSVEFRLVQRRSIWLEFSREFVFKESLGVKLSLCLCLCVCGFVWGVREREKRGVH